MLTSTVSATEAAHFLMIGLGPMRAWTDFLSDNIRQRQSINGAALLPCCELHDGHKYRPRYAISDIRRFIAEVRSKMPGRCEIQTRILDINPGKAWFVSKFDKHGVPVSFASIHIH